MYCEHAKFGLGAQSINLTSLNIYMDTLHALQLYPDIGPVNLDLVFTIRLLHQRKETACLDCEK